MLWLNTVKRELQDPFPFRSLSPLAIVPGTDTLSSVWLCYCHSIRHSCHLFRYVVLSIVHCFVYCYIVWACDYIICLHPWYIACSHYVVTVLARILHALLNVYTRSVWRYFWQVKQVMKSVKVYVSDNFDEFWNMKACMSDKCKRFWKPDMIWYETIRYDMIWSDKSWYVMIWYEMTWYDMKRYDVMWYESDK